MYQYTHPFTIFSNLWRVFYLIIIPVIRGFLSAVTGDFAAWVQGAWIDILILLLMVTLAVVRWRCVTYRWDDEFIVLRSGTIFRKKIRLPWKNVTTVSAFESLYLRPFHAVHLRIDTLGGGSRRSDIAIFLHHRKAQPILDSRKEQASEAIGRKYEPRMKSVLALALLTSNSLGGIIFVATFISQSGKLLGNEFSDMIIGTFEEVARTLAFGIPPAAAAIAYALLVGWLIGFWLTFIKYKNFLVARKANSLHVTSGIFTHRTYAVQAGNVNFIEIRQSLTTKALKLYSLYISAVGYGKHKDDLSCIIPTERGEKFRHNRKMLFPGYKLCPAQIRPHARGILRFLSDPLIPCAAIPLAMGIFIYLFPSWSAFIWFVGLMSLVPALLFLVVRIVDFATGGIGKANGYYTIRYSKAFNLHTVLIPEEKIVYTELRQSLFQVMGGGDNCDLIIHTVAESRNRHKCRNLRKKELADLLHIGA